MLLSWKSQIKLVLLLSKYILFIIHKGSFTGLVGLSYPMDGEYSLFDKMIELDILDEPIFAFYMDRTPGSENSKILFGGIDDTLYDGEIHWHNVSE